MTFPAIIAAVTPITLPTSTVNSRPTPPLSCACSCNSSSIFTVRNPSNRRSNPIGPIRRIKAAASDSTAIVDNPTVVSTSEEDEMRAKIGARVRVTVPLKVYHVPKVAEVDLNGKEGKVKEYVAVWKGRDVRPRRSRGRQHRREVSAEAAACSCGGSSATSSSDGGDRHRTVDASAI